MNKETEPKTNTKGRKTLEKIAGLVIIVAAEMPLLRLIGVGLLIDGIIGHGRAKN